mgnify:CR=1 FL=1
MSTKLTTILVLILIAAAVIAGLVLWNQLPDPMASHWNENDEVDGYMGRFWGVWMMPLVVLGMAALFLVIPNIDPLKANIEKFRGVFNLFIPAFMLYNHALTLAWNLGYQDFRMSAAMLPFMGILFIFVGYMLRQAKRNWFIGIRTPGTLSSDTVWDKTHRLGSWLFTASGVFAFAGSFFGGMTAVWLTLAPALGSAVFLVIYSFVMYQREMKGQ